jgi:protein-arginine kinase
MHDLLQMATFDLNFKDELEMIREIDSSIDQNLSYREVLK